MKNIIDRKTARAMSAMTSSVAAAILLTACAMGGPSQLPEFHQKRTLDLEDMREYRNCRDDAIELDTKARKDGDPGRYISSARLLKKCESRLTRGASVGRDERMRHYALSVQNYLKGGDVESAQATLKSFKKKFPLNDLYYLDGSSFIDTMEVLLGQKDLRTFGETEQLNVSRELKDELSRLRHWKRN